MSNSVRSNRFRTRVMAAAAGGALLMATGSTAVASAQPGLNTTESNNADSKPDSKPDSGNQTSQPGLNTTPAEESPAPQGNQGQGEGQGQGNQTPQPGLNTTPAEESPAPQGNQGQGEGQGQGNQTPQPGLNTTPAEESPAPQGNQGQGQGNQTQPVEPQPTTPAPSYEEPTTPAPSYEQPTTPVEESPAPQGNQGDNQGGNSFEGVSDSNTDYIEEAPQADPAPQEAPVENQTPQAPEQQAAPQPEQQPAPQYQDQAPAVPAQPQPEQQPVEQKPVEPQLSEYEQAVHDLTSNYEQVSLAATAPPQCGEGATPACDAANGAAQAAEKFTQVINADGMIANAAAALETNSTTNQAVIDASHTANANADQRVAQAQQYGDTTNAAIAGFDQNVMGGQGDMESYGL